MKKIQLTTPTTCNQCYELDKEYFTTTSGKKVCKDCGGTVLYPQEAADMLASLQSEVRELKELLGLYGEKQEER